MLSHRLARKMHWRLFKPRVGPGHLGSACSGLTSTEDIAKKEAQDAVKLAKEEGAKRIFLPAPSPGVTTIFFPADKAYKDHYEYLFDVGKELRKEYQAILSVEGVDLQLDAPTLPWASRLAHG